MNILQEISEYTKSRIDSQKRVSPLSELIRQAESTPVGDFAFEKSLKSDNIAFICEVKKASPSKGIIAEDFAYKQIAQEYESAGAAAISVLTEPNWFKGDDLYLREIAEKSGIPLLRKDFTVDPYMIYEAKLLGASAVLLICSILDCSQISEYIKIADSLGLSSLVETHDEREIESALTAGARVVGVNNRDLKTFEVDITLSQRLRGLVPPETVFVSESGIKTPEDVESLRKSGVDAVLIGETIMRSPDKKSEIAKLRGINLD
ncbi:MAG: indole-3-glycerol phosphate synthase TrpC [Oscillospiraceae bacterium]|nr:indole-3-glycerol phosphate synthase TrpC [Oscillospiraceae bacterium]